jgi:short-subunit dehydrogenase
MTAKSNSKLALITGASSGIGREMACLHASRGGDLVVAARRENELIKLKDELEAAHGTNVHVIPIDLTVPNAAKVIWETTDTNGWQIDYLINNAGLGGHGFFHERATSEDLAMIQVNLVALTELMHLYLPGMVARNRGRILNISSTASMMPGPLQSTYFATKAYVSSLSQGIAEELCDTNVTVTALCPGFVDTNFVATANLAGVKALEKKGTAKSPTAVAKQGYEAMLDGKLLVITEPGLKFTIDYVLPLLSRKRILKISRSMMEKQ